MSRNLTPREEHDVTEMLREAPNVEPQDLDGTIVWYEWVTQNGRQYHLSYWFDDDDNEYKAAVIEGLEPNEQLPRSISSDGMINLRSSHNTPCSGVVEARKRAIEALKHKQPEDANMNEERMRIMTLGFSNAGKTFYLGSLDKLSFDYGSKGFSLQTEDYIVSDEISKIYRIIAGDKEGSIPSTVKLRPHTMILNQGAKPVLRIGITDIEGQALEPDRNVEVAGQIAQQIGKYDGLILIVEAPNTPRESERKKFELSRMLRFAGEVLKRNKSIPMTLVLTKIDELTRAKEIVPQLKEELDTFENTLTQQYKDRYREKQQKRRIQRGSVVNKHVKQFINTENIYELYNNFLDFLRSTDMDIPNKIFLCTNLGFDSINRDRNNNLTVESYREQEIYQPYGTAASFLWTIYARLASQQQGPPIGLTEGTNLGRIKDDLLDDIRELHTSGKAYFDPDDESQSIFSLRNISNLRTEQIEN